MASLLILQSSAGICGVPVEHVVETLRPLPTQAIGNAPPFVLGLTRLRGEAVPVLDLNRLLGSDADTPATRFISLRVGDRHVALAVEALLDLRVVERSALSALPPLLSQGSPAVESIAAMDSGLLLVLACAKWIPQESWQLGQGEAA
jgi:purine-binding chemotaxis protein CheW